MADFGPTGKFPQGKIDASDEGQLTFGIAADHTRGVVVLNFGSPVAWLGLPPAMAKQLAIFLLKSADEIEKGGSLPLVTQ